MCRKEQNSHCKRDTTDRPGDPGPTHSPTSLSSLLRRQEHTSGILPHPPIHTDQQSLISDKDCPAHTIFNSNDPISDPDKPGWTHRDLQTLDRGSKYHYGITVGLNQSRLNMERACVWKVDEADNTTCSCEDFNKLCFVLFFSLKGGRIGYYHNLCTKFWL